MDSSPVRSHATLASASAGRSRAMRQLPKDPAKSPPATASSTAATIAATVTDADIGTATVWLAAAGKAPPTAPPPPAVKMCGPVELAMLADSFGDTAVVIAAPA